MIRTLFGAMTRPRRLGLALLALGLCVTVAWPAFPTTSASYCRVRVLVATPDPASVDVRINSILIASGNKLGEITPYIARPADHYGLRVFPPGAVEGGNAYVMHDVYLEANKDWTIVVFGKLSDKTLDIVAEEDTNTADSAGARIRFGNYIPNTTTLTLKASEGTQSTPIGNAGFGRMTAYTPVPPTVQPGTASLLAVTDRATLRVAQANVRLSANSVITGFAIPGAGGTGTTLLLNLDGGTNKDPLNPASATANAAAASTAAVNGTASALVYGTATAPPCWPRCRPRPWWQWPNCRRRADTCLCSVAGGSSAVHPYVQPSLPYRWSQIPTSKSSTQQRGTHLVGRSRRTGRATVASNSSATRSPRSIRKSAPPTARPTPRSTSSAPASSTTRNRGHAIRGAAGVARARDAQATRRGVTGHKQPPRRQEGTINLSFLASW